MTKIMKIVSVTHKCDQPTMGFTNKYPSMSAPGADIPLSTLLSRFINGQSLPSGSVHLAQYSDELNPLTRKGIDLADYGELKQYADARALQLTDDIIAQDKAKKQAKQAQQTPPPEQVPPSASSN